MFDVTSAAKAAPEAPKASEAADDIILCNSEPLQVEHVAGADRCVPWVVTGAAADEFVYDLYYAPDAPAASMHNW